MPRGGKREGAGRKPRLRFLERMRVGARCQHLWREAYEANARAALSEQTEIVRDEWDVARAMPIRDRKAWMQSPEFTQYLCDVQISLQESQGLSEDQEPARIVRVEPVRPKIGKRIITQVAGEYSETERMIERCWEEFRKFERDTE